MLGLGLVLKANVFGLGLAAGDFGPAIPGLGIVALLTATWRASKH